MSEKESKMEDLEEEIGRLSILSNSEFSRNNERSKSVKEDRPQSKFKKTKNETQNDDSEYDELMEQIYPGQEAGTHLETNEKLVDQEEESQPKNNTPTPAIISAVKMAEAQARLDKALTKRK